MYPSIDLFGLSFPTGPLSLIVAFYVGLWWAGREADRLDLSPNLPWDFGTIALIAGLVGARVSYVIANWPAYALDFTQAFALASGSLAVWPGAAIGVVVGLVWIRRAGVDWAAFFDAMAPGLALMQMVVSLGAFLTGDAYGSVSDIPWAVEMWGASRHPVQLYDALVALMTFGILWKLRDRKPYAGFVFVVYVGLAAVGRLITEAFRGNPALLPGGLRTLQVVSFGVALGAVGILYFHAAGILRVPVSKNREQG